MEEGLGSRQDGVIIMDLLSRSRQLEFPGSAWGGGRAQHAILTFKCQFYVAVPTQQPACSLVVKDQASLYPTPTNHALELDRLNEHKTNTKTS